MKIKIVISCIVVVSIILMVPSISAVKFNIVLEANKMQIMNQLEKIPVNTLERNPKINMFDGLRNFVSQRKMQNSSAIPLFWRIVQFINKMITIYVEQPIESFILLLRLMLYSIMDSFGLIPYYKY